MEKFTSLLQGGYKNSFWLKCVLLLLSTVIYVSGYTFPAMPEIRETMECACAEFEQRICSLKLDSKNFMFFIRVQYVEKFRCFLNFWCWGRGLLWLHTESMWLFSWLLLLACLCERKIHYFKFQPFQIVSKTIHLSSNICIPSNYKTWGKNLLSNTSVITSLPTVVSTLWAEEVQIRKKSLC